MDSEQNSGSIEFGETEDDSLRIEIGRMYYRVPTEGKQNFSVVIAGRSFRLQDINALGVGFIAEPDTQFPIGKILSPCDLNLSGTQITGLQAEVIHNSPSGLDQSVCGIRWLELGPDQDAKIATVMQRLKKELATEAENRVIWEQ